MKVHHDSPAKGVLVLLTTSMHCHGFSSERASGQWVTSERVTAISTLGSISYDKLHTNLFSTAFEALENKSNTNKLQM